MSKKIGLVGVFVLLLGLGGVMLYFNIAALTKSYLEKMGTEILGAELTIDSLNLSFRDKTVTVRGIAIKNPEGHGFTEDAVMVVDAIDVQAQSLSGEKLVFDTIRISGTALNVEMAGGGSNISVLRKNLERPSKGGGPKDAAKPHKGQTAKVIIKSFVMDKASLTPSVRMPGGLELKPITLPRIELTGIGEREDGILAREAATQIFSRIFATAVEKATQGGFLKALTDNLPTLEDGKKAADDLLNIFGR